MNSLSKRRKCNHEFSILIGNRNFHCNSGKGKLGQGKEGV